MDYYQCNYKACAVAKPAQLGTLNPNPLAPEASTTCLVWGVLEMVADAVRKSKSDIVLSTLVDSIYRMTRSYWPLRHHRADSGAGLSGFPIEG
jgi:hypothetical protein